MKYLQFVAMPLIMALFLSACSVSAPVSSTPIPIPTGLATETPTETLPTLTPVIVTQTATPAPLEADATATVPASVGKLISNNGVEFTIPAGLGTDALGSIVPEVLLTENAGPAGGHPAYMQFKLQGYPLAGTEYFYAEIQVYDAKAYAADFTAGAKNSEKVNAILNAPNMPLTQADMPPDYLQIASNMQRVASANLKGVRMLSVRGNGMPMATNEYLAYQFHGLSADGKFYILVTLPITAPFLPAKFDTAADEGLVMFPQEDVTESAISGYIAKVVNLLGQAETAGMLSPSVALMDALVQSIKITSGELVLPAPLPTPAASGQEATATPTASATPCDAVGFVKDVTYPDGTQVKAGEVFIKTWRIQNTGSCSWKESYTLVFYTGEQMGGNSPTTA